MQTLTANEAKTHFFEYENFKMETLKQIVSQSRNDIANGNIIDGEVFMQELLDGKHDK